MLLRGVDHFAPAERIVESMFRIPNHGQRHGLLRRPAARHEELRGTLASMALRGNFDGLITRVVLQQAGETGYADWPRILLPLVDFQARVGIRMCHPGCGRCPLRDRRSLLQSWVVSLRQGNGLRQGEAKAFLWGRSSSGLRGLPKEKRSLDSRNRQTRNRQTRSLKTLGRGELAAKG